MDQPDRRPVVAIVDPYSSGEYLAAEFAARGWASLAVLSSPVTPVAYGDLQHRDQYQAVLTGDDIDDLVKAVAPYGPRAIIPGTEIGVSMADQLADHFRTPGNGVALSTSRRDKFAMADTLSAAGIAAPATITATHAEEIIEWAHATAGWPVVVKPIDSAGSDGVTFCQNPDQVRRTFARLYAKPHQLGNDVRMLLGQELLRGQQYFVNTISVDGLHYVAEIWKDVRKPIEGASLAYDVEDLLAPHGEIQDRLIEYVTTVLDALGIRWGPAHSEIMVTSRGPVLIETGARMQGTILPHSVQSATGHSQVTLTVDCYTDPQSFADRADRRYQLHREVRVVSLIAPHDGYIARGEAAEQLGLLPTLHDVIGSITPGTQVKRTVDLFTSPASLYLVAENRDALDRDYHTIRRLETEGLYTATSPDIWTLSPMTS